MRPAAGGCFVARGNAARAPELIEVQASQSADVSCVTPVPADVSKPKTTAKLSREETIARWLHRLAFGVFAASFVAPLPAIAESYNRNALLVLSGVIWLASYVPVIGNDEDRASVIFGSACWMAAAYLTAHNITSGLRSSRKSTARRLPRCSPTASAFCWSDGPRGESTIQVRSKSNSASHGSMPRLGPPITSSPRQKSGQPCRLGAS